MHLSRRNFALGALVLPGCSTLDLLAPSGPVREIYQLQPVSLDPQGGRTSRSLIVLMPAAPAALSTDRILISADPLTVQYLPDAAWSDSVPQMLQSVLIRSLASAQRIGFVGLQGAGPVPDTVLLTRIDAFGVAVLPQGGFEARVALELTVLRDRDQRVLGTRVFTDAIPLTDDRADTIARGFQTLMDRILPEAATWVLARAA
ncbi:ABC-type transport auxiliary lipoprotein family protein [Cognatiyoonia sp. IB215182]|uniref:ABC-type transport auxiliary lipoprotein family protein n=1 Tax=Cognatiyoonia sp. IB215182 TaxID=3097353 RepID=UPI002A0CDE91|nr:ABC-type transport auxiliary lipoprotein family protein [Cognatiyoonia sp. IB215182]MDX8354951.1 ABC-type transport auxiliary lipoprotein family protein [Cognatiyoonia sp. IB215182]